jgi:hypothetical protein
MELSLLPYCKVDTAALLQTAVLSAEVNGLNHFRAIRELLDVLVASPEVHVLAIESAPGLGKSSTIEAALRAMGAPYRSVGSYSTALHLYNTLSTAHRDEILILDDCAGLFTNDVSMAILKGATWASAGYGGERRVKWGSTTTLKASDEFTFRGKLVLIANHIPRGEDTKAFLQRAMHLRVDLSDKELADLLTEAANSELHFADVSLAAEVSQYLVKNLSRYNSTEINIRTLRKGYEIAKLKPHCWQPLLEKILPKTSPQDIVQQLSRSSMTVVEQAKEFARVTKMSERSFYYHRKAALGNAKTNKTKGAN